MKKRGISSEIVSFIIFNSLLEALEAIMNGLRNISINHSLL